ATASFCASSRKPRTSSSSRARRCSASLNRRSASALAAAALLIEELIFSALERKLGGSFLPKTQINAPATMAKLIHLNNSFGTAVLAPPSAAAACAATAKSVALHTNSGETMDLRRLIEPLARGLLEAAALETRFPRRAEKFRPARR